MVEKKAPFRVIRLFEYLRIILVTVGYCLAYLNPSQAAYYLVLGLVLPMNGLVAVEAICFSGDTARFKGRAPSVYQLQSALFQVAIFTVAAIALWLQAGLQAQLVLLAVTLLFFFLSGLVHLWEFLHKAPRVNLWRFVGSLSTVLFTLVAVWPQLHVL